MAKIIENLGDLSWWFTGLFFTLLSGLVVPAAARWLAIGCQRLRDRFPRLLRRWARHLELRRKRRIRELRFHPLLVVRRIVDCSMWEAVFWILFFLYCLGSVFLPFAGAHCPETRHLYFLLFLPILGLEIWVLARRDFVKELLASCRKVGTTRRQPLPAGKG